jgi:hypothetical protein
MKIEKVKKYMPRLVSMAVLAMVALLLISRPKPANTELITHFPKLTVDQQNGLAYVNDVRAERRTEATVAKMQLEQTVTNLLMKQDCPAPPDSQSKNLK